MSNSIVRVTNLSHRYAMQWAVQNVNLEIQNTGIYGLLGANGAGKSTIMNIMCGVIRQSKGEVFVKETSMSAEPAKAKRQIGFLPQKPPLLMEHTIEEYLQYAAELRLMDDKLIPQAVEEVMEKCSLTHLRKRLIKHLSGGYQQRVGIAQSIIHKPDFVIMDEPTNGLDPNQIIGVRRLIREIAVDRTVILSTHILQEVQALCDFIWMINEGRVVFSGSIKDFDSYMSPNSLHVTLLAGPPSAAIGVLEGVVDVEQLTDTKYRISYSADAYDIIDRIVETSVYNKWKLVEIGLEKVSLDAIFAELSAKKSKGLN